MGLMSGNPYYTGGGFGEALGDAVNTGLGAYFKSRENTRQDAQLAEAKRTALIMDQLRQAQIGQMQQQAEEARIKIEAARKAQENQVLQKAALEGLLPASANQAMFEASKNPEALQTGLLNINGKQAYELTPSGEAQINSAMNRSPNGEQIFKAIAPFMSADELGKEATKMATAKEPINPIVKQLIDSAQAGTLDKRGKDILDSLGYGGIFTPKPDKANISAEADDKFRKIAQAMEMKQPVAPEDMAWYKAYEKQKSIAAEAYGRTRVEVALSQPVAVVDKTTGETTWITKKDLAYDINGARDKFMAMGVGEKAKMKTAVMEDIQGASENTRKSLSRLDKDFSLEQRAQLAYLLKSNEAGAFTKFMQSAVASTLTPAQVDYITDVVQLKENAYALRTVLGAGQGSDELRRAISDTIPGALSPNRQYALTQLDKFDGQLTRLKKAYFKIKNQEPEKVSTGAPNVQEKTITRTGVDTATGEKVTQWSDGSITRSK